MSVNVIIIAVLALLVLVVLAFIFTGKIGQFTTGTSNCESVNSNYQCEYSCGDGYAESSSLKCLGSDNEPTGEVCCIPLG
jgi:hypothetical protein